MASRLSISKSTARFQEDHSVQHLRQHCAIRVSPSAISWSQWVSRSSSMGSPIIEPLYRMGEFRVGGLPLAMGWVTTGVMGAASLAMIIQLILG